MMNDKEYNTHLVKLWLNNNQGNYNNQQSMQKSTLNNDQKLMGFLKQQNYGGDRNKIDFNKNKLDLNDIRNTIKDNHLP